MTQDEALKCPIHEVNMFDPEFLQQPYPFYARLREEAPVYRDEANQVVHVSTYELITAVNRQPNLFSNNFLLFLTSGGEMDIDPEELAIMSEGIMPVNTILTADPPVHTRFKKLAMKGFSYKRVLELAPYVETLVNELIDEMPEGGCDIKSEFADKLPILVIADALGLPRDIRPKFEEWTQASIDRFSGIPDRDARLAATRKVVEMHKYFAPLYEEKRHTPSEDVLSDLVNADLAEDGDPRKMTDEELMSIVSQLVVAGSETTAHSITAGLHYALAIPGLKERILEDEQACANFVEETLRMLTPTNNMWRIATEDTELAGVAIKAGDRVLLRYGSGNHDAAKFADPETFNIDREGVKDHLAFGYGIHTCLGAQLARKEMQVAFPLLLSRLKNLSLDTERNTMRYVPNILLRGVTELHLRYDKV